MFVTYINLYLFWDLQKLTNYWRSCQMSNAHGKHLNSPSTDKLAWTYDIYKNYCCHSDLSTKSDTKYDAVYNMSPIIKAVIAYHETCVQ